MQITHKGHYPLKIMNTINRPEIKIKYIFSPVEPRRDPDPLRDEFSAITPLQSNLNTEGFTYKNRLLPLRSGFSSAHIPLGYMADDTLSSKNNITVTNLNKPIINKPFMAMKVYNE